MATGDGYYQAQSFLEYTPTPGEKLTCMVEHPSLSEPMLQVWAKLELDFNIGCFDSGDTQLSAALDGDKLYMDFKKGKAVVNIKIPYAADIPRAFEHANVVDYYCKSMLSKLKEMEPTITKATDAPESIIYPREEMMMEVENTLICFINHFFPPTIKIKWTKNEKELPAEDPLIQYLPNHDGTFHVLSTLRFVPQRGDIYACTVEHEALEEPQTRFWEPDITETSSGPDVFCGVGLSLGLLGICTGIFLFVKRNHYN
ncbi:H-2 class II histocompatibility antigen, A-U alpha chain-like [Polymixia lowei]